MDGPIKDMYEKCADLVKNGNVIMEVLPNGKIKDSFPKETKERGGNGVVMLDLMEEWRLICLNYRFQIN